MQVGLVTGKHTLELREMPQPLPAPGKAVVDIAYCGICGTDLHAYQSGEPYNPAICGHEWTGSVSAVGSRRDHAFAKAIASQSAPRPRAVPARRAGAATQRIAKPRSPA